MAQKPLDEAGGRAPRICFRLAAPKHERVTALAEESEQTVSELIRDLLDRELERAEPPPLRSG